MTNAPAKPAPARKRRRGRVLLVIAIIIMLFALAAALLYPSIKQRLYPMEYSAVVAHWAGEYGLDPFLVYAIIRTESGFDPKADSHAGARGLMQMTEPTFDWIKSRIAPGEDLAFEDLYDPEVAVRFGAYFYLISLEKYGEDIPTAAAAYHSGWGTVDGLLEQGEYSKDGKTLVKFPYNQMAHYVNKINDSYKWYRQLYQ